MEPNRLRQLRVNAGLSISEFARKAGITAGHVYKIETGKAGTLRLSTITKIAKALDVADDRVFPLPLAEPKKRWAPSGMTWNVILTCPKCRERFGLVVTEGMPEPGDGGVSCPICGFVQTISLRRGT